MIPLLLVLIAAPAWSRVEQLGAGARVLARAEVRKVRVAAASRRARQGLLWHAIDAAAGAGRGVAVCPGCSGEGKGARFAALAFLPMPWRTVYRQ